MSDQIQILWKYRSWLTVFAVLTVGAAVVLSVSQERTYEAAARVRLIPSQQLADLSLPDPTGLDRFVETYAEVARSTPVIDDAAKRTDPQASPATLNDSISVTTERSGVLRIKASAPSGRRAADYANDVADAFVRHVAQIGDATRRAAVSRISQRMRLAASQLNRAKPRSGEARALLTELQQLSARLADSQARPSDQALIVDRASVPVRASSPRPIRSALLALIFALFAGSALAYAHYSLSTRFESATEASDDLDMPLLGVLPRARPRDAAALDAFRAIRTNARFALRRRIENPTGVTPTRPLSYHGATGANASVGPDGRMPGDPPSPEPRDTRRGSVILVTSPAAESGKTYVTAGLASAFAAEGQRVVAIDADLRRPTLHERFNAPLEPGVADFLDGMCDFLADARPASRVPSRRAPVTSDVARRGGALEVLPAGQPRQDSSEILSSGRMADLIERVRLDFAVAVVNSPPSLSVTDAAVLARYADGVILVVDARRTRKRAAERAVHELRSLDAPLLGIVFNRATRSDAHYGYRRGSRSELEAEGAVDGYAPLALQMATMNEQKSQA
jgi:capsular exopolysaccharide synthesis family protein